MNIKEESTSKEISLVLIIITLLIGIGCLVENHHQDKDINDNIGFLLDNTIVLTDL